MAIPFTDGTFDINEHKFSEAIQSDHYNIPYYRQSLLWILLLTGTEDEESVLYQVPPEIINHIMSFVADPHIDFLMAYLLLPTYFPKELYIIRSIEAKKDIELISKVFDKELHFANISYSDSVKKSPNQNEYNVYSDLNISFKDKLHQCQSEIGIFPEDLGLKNESIIILNNLYNPQLIRQLCYHVEWNGNITKRHRIIFIVNQDTYSLEHLRVNFEDFKLLYNYKVFHTKMTKKMRTYLKYHFSPHTIFPIKT